jgi:hypothetical protein
MRWDSCIYKNNDMEMYKRVLMYGNYEVDDNRRNTAQRLND